MRKLELEYRCPKRIDELTGTGSRRHCDDCRHDVALLHEMTEAEARRFLSNVDPERRTCVAYLLDADDRPMFRPEPSRSIGGGEVVLAMALSALVPLGAVGATLVDVNAKLSATDSETPDAIAIDETAGARLDVRAPTSTMPPAVYPTATPGSSFDDWTYVGDDRWLLEDADPVLDDLEVIQRKRNIRMGIAKRRRTKGRLMIGILRSGD